MYRNHWQWAALGAGSTASGVLELGMEPEREDKDVEV
jgi:hypothetical protein